MLWISSCEITELTKGRIARDISFMGLSSAAMRFELKAGKKAEKISPRHIRVFSGSFNHAAAALDAGFSGEVEL